MFLITQERTVGEVYLVEGQISLQTKNCVDSTFRCPKRIYTIYSTCKMEAQQIIVGCWLQTGAVSSTTKFPPCVNALKKKPFSQSKQNSRLDMGEQIYRLTRQRTRFESELFHNGRTCSVNRQISSLLDSTRPISQCIIERNRKYCPSAGSAVPIATRGRSPLPRTPIWGETRIHRVGHIHLYGRCIGADGEEEAKAWTVRWRINGGTFGRRGPTLFTVLELSHAWDCSDSHYRILQRCPAIVRPPRNNGERQPLLLS